MKSHPTPAGCGTSSRTRSSTRIASAVISAGCWRPIPRSQGGSASSWKTNGPSERVRCWSRAEGRNVKARVTVTLKTGILDPQGKAIEGALRSLGVDGVASVRQGKVFDIELSGSDKAKAEAALKAAADKLLANTVIENYRVELL